MESFSNLQFQMTELMLFGHVPMEKLLMHPLLGVFAVFSVAVYTDFIGQIWLDGGDVEARAKCNFLICVASAVMIVVRMCYQFSPVLALKV